MTDRFALFIWCLYKCNVADAGAVNKWGAEGRQAGNLEEMG